ncbi:MAG TPA: HDOD domain-containing protein [Gammaproteobacteria bacterium]
MSALESKHIAQGNRPGTVQELVQGVVGLISLPDVCVRVKEMVDNPECSAADIGKVVSQDAALTARLLRIVNSAFYQFPARIETVSRAITVVGNRELKDLVFAATVAGIFEKVSNDLIDIESFWRHAVYCGIVSRIIARKSRVLHSERLFVAGLMHDIGRMVIAFKLPDQCREVLRYRKEHGVELHVAENTVLGFDHAQVGAELMKAWSLPQTHQTAALHHHSPEKAGDFVLEASIVYLANIITELAEAGTNDLEILSSVPRDVWQMTKVSIDDIENVLVEARDQFIDALTLIRAREGKSTHHVA